MKGVLDIDNKQEQYIDAALDRLIIRRAEATGEAPLTRAEAMALIVNYLRDTDALDVVAERAPVGEEE